MALIIALVLIFALSVAADTVNEANLYSLNYKHALPVANDAANKANLYVFNDEEVKQWNARCLDGSPSGFYYSLATDPAYSDKWAILLDGGGVCLPNAKWVNVEDCKQRAHTQLGSSKDWPKSLTPTYLPPPVGQYNFIEIPYCSGDLHAGTRTTPQDNLYYSGHLNVDAVIQKLKAYGLSKATELVVVGGSAGGIGVFANIDYIQEQLPSTKVTGLPDAGWFILVPPYNPNFLGLQDLTMILHNVSAFYVNQKCAVAYPGKEYQCISANYTYPYITTPLFIAQSLFDSEQLVIQDGAGTDFNDRKANQYKVQFGAVMRDTIQQVLKNPSSGLFASTDFTHVIGFGDKINGTTLATIFTNWRTGQGNSKLVSPCTTPSCKPIPLPPGN